ncbi:MAG: hypothetical protein IJX15_05555 [Ruminiclostridium sp.]|nr:hypothetical protein [Ruminiclostridium sp.]
MNKNNASVLFSEITVKEKKNMKRFIFSLSLIGAVLLSGCTAIPKKAPDIDKSFCAEAEITVGKESFSGKLSRISSNSWELELSEPFALGGAVITFGEEGTKITLGDFTAEADITDGTASALKIIASAFEESAKDGVTFENNAFSGTSTFCTYTVSVSDNVIPENISIPEKNISVSLSEWTETEPEEIIVE